MLKQEMLLQQKSRQLLRTGFIKCLSKHAKVNLFRGDQRAMIKLPIQEK